MLFGSLIVRTGVCGKGQGHQQWETLWNGSFGKILKYRSGCSTVAPLSKVPAGPPCRQPRRGQQGGPASTTTSLVIGGNLKDCHNRFSFLPTTIYIFLTVLLMFLFVMAATYVSLTQFVPSMHVSRYFVPTILAVISLSSKKLCEVI